MVPSLDRWIGKVAIVTGASAGIGANIAEHLVKTGLIVVGLARRSERIDSLSEKLANEKGKLYAVKADLTKEEDILNAFIWTTENVGPVHILINNAGLVLNTDLIDGETEKWKTILDTNVLALCIATREAIKVMQKNNIDGQIVHINSGAGHAVPDFAGLNVYPASKYAVTALTETLRWELIRTDSKIKITSISPGFVKTDSFMSNYENLSLEMRAYFDKCSSMTPDDISNAVLYVLSTPSHFQVHELFLAPIVSNKTATRYDEQRSTN